MPHTSHKKGGSHDKRRNVPGGDGWTHVARGPPAGFPSPLSTNGNCKLTFDVGEPRRGLTVENMWEHDVQIVARWKETAMYAHLVRYFEQHILELDYLRITSCVCVGLGNLTTYFGRPDTCLTQLAALETMLEILGRKHTIEHVYIQDPKFNALDKEFLSSKGFHVLESPHAEQYVGPNTFVFAPFVTWTVLPPLLSAPIPALFVCNSVELYLHMWDIRGQPDLGGFDIETFEHFLDQCTSFTLPDFTSERESDNGLDMLGIYFKRDPKIEDE